MAGWNPYGLAPWISEWRARGIVPLTAGMRLISGVVMQMPLRHFRGDLEVIPPAPVVANPAPADNGTLASYIDGYISDISLYGNHLAILGEPDSTGWPACVLPVDVTKLSVARAEGSGQLLYHYADTDDEAVLTSSEVIHVALDRRSGELVGRGLIPTMAAAPAGVHGGGGVRSPVFRRVGHPHRGDPGRPARPDPGPGHRAKAAVAGHRRRPATDTYRAPVHYHLHPARF